MANKPCPRCGAPGAGFVCSYCGAAMLAHGDDGAELAALEQYHALLDATKPGTDQCSRLIVEGFVPSGRKALIEAGLRFGNVDPVLAEPRATEDMWSFFENHPRR